MRAIFLAAVLASGLSASAQYYYKDIIGTRESSDLIRAYKQSRVSHVALSSYDASNRKDEDFFVEQQFVPATGSLVTTTRSQADGASVLASFADASGNVVRTVDSSGAVLSTTEYAYNSAGQLATVVSSSADSSGSASESEQHIWQWSNGKPSRMLRIKNGRDTTFVNFKLDEKGNVSEETETHKGQTSDPVYYYYNDKGLLSDIVRFNKRAGRMLPDYMFEYYDSRQVSQKITVPANNSDYLIWRYQYNGQGLKTKEVIYNKDKKMIGRIEYQYAFGS